MEERRMYLFRYDFSSCSESTEIRHADSSYVKSCTHTYFLKSRKQGFKHTDESPPPSPLSLSPSNCGNAQCFSSQGSKSYVVREGGGGRFMPNFVHICLPAWKNQQHRDIFLTQKELACLIYSEQLENSQQNRYICLSSIEPFNCPVPNVIYLCNSLIL